MKAAVADGEFLFNLCIRCVSCHWWCILMFRYMYILDILHLLVINGIKLMCIGSIDMII